MKTNRRTFIGTAAAGSLALGRAARAAEENRTLNLGVIGVGWYGEREVPGTYHEVLPAIRKDCEDDEIEILTAGASLGAFNALAFLCRHPDAFRLAIAMSGTFDLARFLQGPMTQDFYFSSPLHYLPKLEGEQLERLRLRLILMPSGEGDYEDIGESWRLASVLGAKGIPNRVDSWGVDYHHNWETWREMLPRYLDKYA